MDETNDWDDNDDWGEPEMVFTNNQSDDLPEHFVLSKTDEVSLKVNFDVNDAQMNEMNKTSENIDEDNDLIISHNESNEFSSFSSSSSSFFTQQLQEIKFLLQQPPSTVVSNGKLIEMIDTIISTFLQKSQTKSKPAAGVACSNCELLEKEKCEAIESVKLLQKDCDLFVDKFARLQAENVYYREELLDLRQKYNSKEELFSHSEPIGSQLSWIDNERTSHDIDSFPSLIDIPPPPTAPALFTTPNGKQQTTATKTSIATSSSSTTPPKNAPSVGNNLILIPQLGESQALIQALRGELMTLQLTHSQMFQSQSREVEIKDAIIDSLNALVGELRGSPTNIANNYSSPANNNDEISTSTTASNSSNNSSTTTSRQGNNLIKDCFLTEHNELIQRNEQLQDEIMELTVKLQSNDEKITLLKQQIEYFHLPPQDVGALSTFVTTSTGTQTNVDKLEKKLKIKLHSCNDKIEMLENEKTSLSYEVAALDEENTGLLNDLQETKTLIEKLQNELKGKEQENRCLHEEKVELKKKMEEIVIENNLVLTKVTDDLQEKFIKMQQDKESEIVGLLQKLNNIDKEKENLTQLLEVETSKANNEIPILEELTQEINEFKQNLKDKEDENSKLMEKLNDFEEKLQDIQNENEKLILLLEVENMKKNNEINALDQLTKQIYEIEENLKMKDAENDLLNEKLQNVEEENKKLISLLEVDDKNRISVKEEFTHQMHETEVNLKEKESENDILIKKIENLQEKLQEIQEENANLIKLQQEINQVEELTQQLLDIRQNLLTKDSEIDILNNKIQEIQEENEKLSNLLEVENMKKNNEINALDQLTQQIYEIQANVKVKDSENDLLTKKLQEVEHENEKLLSLLETDESNKDAKLQELIQHLHEMEVKFNAKQSEYETIQNKLNEYQKENENLTRLLEVGNNDKSNEIFLLEEKIEEYKFENESLNESIQNASVSLINVLALIDQAGDNNSHQLSFTLNQLIAKIKTQVTFYKQELEEEYVASDQLKEKLRLESEKCLEKEKENHQIKEKLTKLMKRCKIQQNQIQKFQVENQIDLQNIIAILHEINQTFHIDRQLDENSNEIQWILLTLIDLKEKIEFSPTVAPPAAPPTTTTANVEIVEKQTSGWDFEEEEEEEVVVEIEKVIEETKPSVLLQQQQQQQHDILLPDELPSSTDDDEEIIEKIKEIYFLFNQTTSTTIDASSTTLNSTTIELLTHSIQLQLKPTTYQQILHFLTQFINSIQQKNDHLLDKMSEKESYILQLEEDIKSANIQLQSVETLVEKWEGINNNTSSPEISDKSLTEIAIQTEMSLQELLHQSTDYRNLKRDLKKVYLSHKSLEEKNHEIFQFLTKWYSSLTTLSSSSNNAENSPNLIDLCTKLKYVIETERQQLTYDLEDFQEKLIQKENEKEILFEKNKEIFNILNNLQHKFNEEETNWMNQFHEKQVELLEKNNFITNLQNENENLLEKKKEIFEILNNLQRKFNEEEENWLILLQEKQDELLEQNKFIANLQNENKNLSKKTEEIVENFEKTIFQEKSNYLQLIQQKDNELTNQKLHFENLLNEKEKILFLDQFTQVEENSLDDLIFGSRAYRKIKKQVVLVTEKFTHCQNCLQEMEEKYQKNETILINILQTLQSTCSRQNEFSYHLHDDNLPGVFLTYLQKENQEKQEILNELDNLQKETASQILTIKNLENALQTQEEYLHEHMDMINNQQQEINRLSHLADERDILLQELHRQYPRREIKNFNSPVSIILLKEEITKLEEEKWNLCSELTFYKERNLSLEKQLEQWKRSDHLMLKLNEFEKILTEKTPAVVVGGGGVGRTYSPIHPQLTTSTSSTSVQKLGFYSSSLLQQQQHQQQVNSPQYKQLEEQLQYLKKQLEHHTMNRLELDEIKQLLTKRTEELHLAKEEIFSLEKTIRQQQSLSVFHKSTSIDDEYFLQEFTHSIDIQCNLEVDYYRQLQEKNQLLKEKLDSLKNVASHLEEEKRLKLINEEELMELRKLSEIWKQEHGLIATLQEKLDLSFVESTNLRNIINQNQCDYLHQQQLISELQCQRSSLEEELLLVKSQFNTINIPPPPPLPVIVNKQHRACQVSMENVGALNYELNCLREECQFSVLHLRKELQEACLKIIQLESVIKWLKENGGVIVDEVSLISTLPPNSNSNSGGGIVDNGSETTIIGENIILPTVSSSTVVVAAAAASNNPIISTCAHCELTRDEEETPTTTIVSVVSLPVVAPAATTTTTLSPTTSSTTAAIENKYAKSIKRVKKLEELLKQKDVELNLIKEENIKLEEQLTQITFSFEETEMALNNLQFNNQMKLQYFIDKFQFMELTSSSSSTSPTPLWPEEICQSIQDFDEHFFSLISTALNEFGKKRESDIQLLREENEYMKMLMQQCQEKISCVDKSLTLCQQIDEICLANDNLKSELTNCRRECLNNVVDQKEGRNHGEKQEEEEEEMSLFQLIKQSFCLKDAQLNELRDCSKKELENYQNQMKFYSNVLKLLCFDDEEAEAGEGGNAQNFEMIWKEVERNCPLESERNEILWENFAEIVKKRNYKRHFLQEQLLQLQNERSNLLQQMDAYVKQIQELKHHQEQRKLREDSCISPNQHQQPKLQKSSCSQSVTSLNSESNFTNDNNSLIVTNTMELNVQTIRRLEERLIKSQENLQYHEHHQQQPTDLIEILPLLRETNRILEIVEKDKRGLNVKYKKSLLALQRAKTQIANLKTATSAAAVTTKCTTSEIAIQTEEENDVTSVENDLQVIEMANVAFQTTTANKCNLQISQEIATTQTDDYVATVDNSPELSELRLYISECEENVLTIQSERDDLACQLNDLRQLNQQLTTNLQTIQEILTNKENQMLQLIDEKLQVDKIHGNLILEINQFKDNLQEKTDYIEILLQERENQANFNEFSSQIDKLNEEKTQIQEEFSQCQATVKQHEEQIHLLIKQKENVENQFNKTQKELEEMKEILETKENENTGWRQWNEQNQQIIHSLQQEVENAKEMLLAKEKEIANWQEKQEECQSQAMTLTKQLEEFKQLFLAKEEELQKSLDCNEQHQEIIKEKQQEIDQLKTILQEKQAEVQHWLGRNEEKDNQVAELVESLKVKQGEIANCQQEWHEQKQAELQELHTILQQKQDEIQHWQEQVNANQQEVENLKENLKLKEAEIQNCYKVEMEKNQEILQIKENQLISLAEEKQRQLTEFQEMLKEKDEEVEDWRQWYEENEETKKQLDELKVILEEKQAEIVKLYEIQEESQLQMMEKQKEIELMKAETKQVVDVTTQSDAELNDKQQQQQHYQLAIQQLESEYQLANQQQHQQIVDLMEKNQNLQQELKHVSDYLDSLAVENEDLRVEHDALLEELEIAKEAYEKLQNDNQQLQMNSLMDASASESQATITVLQQQVNRLQSQLDNTLIERNRIQQEFNRLVRAKSETDAVLARYSQQQQEREVASEPPQPPPPSYQLHLAREYDNNKSTAGGGRGTTTLDEEEEMEKEMEQIKLQNNILQTKCKKMEFKIISLKKKHDTLVQKLEDKDRELDESVDHIRRKLAIQERERTKWLREVANLKNQLQEKVEKIRILEQHARNNITTDDLAHIYLIEVAQLREEVDKLTREMEQMRKAKEEELKSIEGNMEELKSDNRQLQIKLRMAANANFVSSTSPTAATISPTTTTNLLASTTNATSSALAVDSQQQQQHNVCAQCIQLTQMVHALEDELQSLQEQNNSYMGDWDFTSFVDDELCAT